MPHERSGLTTDRTLPVGVRVRVALLFVYLALPIDIIPDFVPVLGYADDAIIVILVLRSVCRRVSVEALRAAWPGSDDGFAALQRLLKNKHQRPSEAVRPSAGEETE
jgi:uncharacterized membrane protein YkvA (DUF1232 family)